jgi:hypothetical protein
MSLISSQGFTEYGISGLTKANADVSRVSSANPQNDVSTLDIPHGGDREYDDGLFDPGPNGATDGIIVTVALEGFGTKPALGSEIEAEGKTCYCTESQYDNSVGDERKWSASYTSDYTLVT